MMWFAARDMIASWRALATTIAIFLTVLVMCLFTLAAYGLAFGSDIVQVFRLEHDPLALCLRLGSDFSAMTAHDVDGISRKIREGVADPAGFRGGFPFRKVEYDCRRGDERGSERARGRTVRLTDPRDPLLESRPPQAGSYDFTGANAPHLSPEAPMWGRVIVTPSLLDQLGMKTVPDALTIEVDARPYRLKVLGCTKADLPGYSFVIFDADERRIARSVCKVRLPRYFSGPMHPDWPPPDKFPPAVLTACNKTWGITLNPFDGGCLMLQSNEERSVFEWRLIIEKIHELLEKHTGKAYRDFYQKADDHGQVRPEDKIEAPDDECNRAAFYFAKAESLVEVEQMLDTTVARMQAEIAAAESADGKADPSRAATLEAERHELSQLIMLRDMNKATFDQVSGIQNSTSAVLRILSVFEALLIVMAAWNVGVVQVMRAILQVKEAGMLKAIGMTRGSLVGIVLLQAVYFWLAASLLGIVLGWETGNLLAHGYYAHRPEEILRGFACSWWLKTSPLRAVALMGAVFSGAGLVCVLSSFIATLSWHFRCAASLLGSD
jgi:hypothetical protein